jgi:hypothetical protein
VDYSDIAAFSSIGGIVVTASLTTLHTLYARKDYRRHQWQERLDLVHSLVETEARPAIGQPGQCNWPSPDGKWRCPLDIGHDGVCENYHAAWWHGLWFPVFPQRISYENLYANMFDVQPGTIWSL